MCPDTCSASPQAHAAERTTFVTVVRFVTTFTLTPVYMYNLYVNITHDGKTYNKHRPVASPGGRGWVVRFQNGNLYCCCELGTNFEKVDKMCIQKGKIAKKGQVDKNLNFADLRLLIIPPRYGATDVKVYMLFCHGPLRKHDIVYTYKSDICWTCFSE